ncbi:MAG TPA: ATP-binding protein [Methylomirabilota bacterium]|nr:ATP-binding protein [Methylomirabilota bacterium]
MAPDWALPGWPFAAAVALAVVEALFIAWLLLRWAARRRAGLVLEKRLQFEALLAKLSAGLIHIPASEINTALEQALQQVVTFLGADRGNLDEYVAGGPGVRIAWALPGLEELPRVMDADQFPWTTKALGRGDIVRFSRTEELPEEAAIDRASYERVGTRSHVSIPLRAGGRMLGVLSFDAVRAESAWSDELVERLRLLSEAFANALERKRIDLSLAERLRFEKLLASLAATFSTLSAADFDREVRGALRRVVDFLGVDGGSLIEFSRDGSTVRSWAIEEWIDVAEFPWMTARLQRGEVVTVSRPDELPDEAAVDRRSYLALRVKPQIAVPLVAGKTVVGGLVLSTVGVDRARPGELMQHLELLGEVFANALSRKQGELEAQRLRQDLAHIGRVSAMGELTASLAHELSQPLTAILNNAQAARHLLPADTVNFGKIRQILDDIVADDKRAGGVIHRLRSLLKKGDLEFVTLDLNEIASEVAWLMRNDALNRDVTMGLDLAADLPRVRGDRAQLQQVVLNLVLNGLEAMREPHTGDRTLIIRTARDGAAAVRLAVQDSGIGIDEANVDRLFQPLHTTKAEGLGMGLAISRTIVDAHRGRLGAANNEHGGATFYFTLPVDTEDVR